MRLKTVQIENFRGLRDVSLDLSSTKLLIGENNSGKTSVLETLRLALSRAAGRRTGTFEPYDYHLGAPDAEPQAANPISITLTLATAEGETLPDEFTQTLGDAIVTDAAGKFFLIFRVTSAFDAALNNFVSDWHFPDVSGNPLGSKSKKPSILQDFQQLFPVFYLSALRDAVREFKTGSYWTPFIKNPSMPAALKQQLQQQIDELNKAVLMPTAHSRL
jgi:putative ATP-dependent endonuclease of the OLD family